MAAEDTKALFFDRNLCGLTPLDSGRAKSFFADLIQRSKEENLSDVDAPLHQSKAEAFLAAVLDLSPSLVKL